MAVVWCGVVWCGVVFRGVAWRDVAVVASREFAYRGWFRDNERGTNGVSTNHTAHSTDHGVVAHTFTH